MSSEKRKMFIPFLIFLVTAKTVRDRKLNFFFIEKLSKMPFETYIVLIA